MRIVPKRFGEINFRALKLEVWSWIIAGIVLFWLASFVDSHVYEWIDIYIRSSELDKIVANLTERIIWSILLAFAAVTAWRIWKNPDHYSRLMPACFAVVAAAIVSVIFKSWFDVPRPFIELGLTPLVQQRIMDSSALPSLHTAVAFAALVPIWRIHRGMGVFWAIFAALIGVARVYENVHWPSDIIAGGAIGGVIGAIFSREETEQVLRYAWRKLEFRRQSLHLLAGFMVVFAHWIGVLRLREIGVLLILGLIACLLTAQGRLPWLEKFLRQFDRPRAYDFPGSGPFYFLLGTGLVFLFFPVKIAYAAILILAVGDSLSHIFSERMPRKINLPWNRRKNIFGVGLGIVAGTFAAQFFVPLWAAFAATSVAIVLETYPWRVGNFFLDDNILIPLSAGSVLYLLL